MKTAELIKEMIQLKRLFYDMVHPGTEHSTEGSSIEPVDTLLSSWLRKKSLNEDTAINFACEFLQQFSAELLDILKPKSIFEVLDLDSSDSDEETPDYYGPFIMSMRKFFNWGGRTHQPEINRKQEKKTDNDKDSTKANQELPKKENTAAPMEIEETKDKGEDYSGTELYQFLEQNPDVAEFLEKNLEGLKKTHAIYSQDCIKKEQSEFMRTITKIQRLFDLRDKLNEFLNSDLTEYFSEGVDIKQAQENLQGQFCNITSKLEDDMVQFLRCIDEWSLTEHEELESLDEQDHYLYILNRYNAIIFGGFYVCPEETKAKFELERKQNIEAISQHFEKHVYPSFAPPAHSSQISLSALNSQFLQSSSQSSSSQSSSSQSSNATFIQNDSKKSNDIPSTTLILSKKRGNSEISEMGPTKSAAFKTPEAENAMLDANATHDDNDSQTPANGERAAKRARRE